MNELCTKHPERQALSYCQNCKNYFCRECLIEKGDYYYCPAEECRRTAPPDPLPERIHCPGCNEYLHLTETERVFRQFLCPSCHKHWDHPADGGTSEEGNFVPEREYANVLTRLGAIVIDSLLVAVFYIPIAIIAGSEFVETSGAIITAILFAGMVVFAIWNGIVRMGKTGQSLGRKFLNIAVLDEAGRPIGIGKAFLREVIGRWVSGIVCYLGYLNAFWDKKKQMWHDKMANCYVYYVEDDFS